MKKLVLGFALFATMISCNKAENEKGAATPSKEFKTAYIDTNKLLEESTEANDIKSKYEAIAKEKGAKLKAEAQNLQNEQKSFQANAQKNGQAWAQQKYGELQQREQQLQYADQALAQDIQTKHGTEMDSVVSKYKRVFKQYGKEKGFDYVFGTGEAATVLYAKDNYDITKEIIKMVNDKYASEGKKEDKPAKK